MPARRRRLLLVSPLPPPMGGIATWTKAVLRSSLRDRFELRLVDTAPSDKSEVSGDSRLRLDRVLDALRILASLCRQLVAFRPDVVHINTVARWAFIRDGAALLLARAAGARVVMHFRGGTYAESFHESGPLAQRLMLFVLRRADRLFALNRDTFDFLTGAVGSRPTRLVPNFVDLDDFGPVADRARREGPVEILFVGWIIEEKGIRELLDAARRLPEARFTLIGPAQKQFLESVRAEIEAQAEHLRLLPPRPREGVLELYHAADVFVLPTWREGFPNVVLEAMAAGLPIVATPVGAIPDAIEDGREGLLVPVRDAAALGDALAALVRDHARRLEMGRRARARVEAQFSFEAVTRRIGDLYDELVPPAEARTPAVGMGSSAE